MNGDAHLFGLEAPRHSHGRVRKGLDLDVRRALEAGAELPAAGVAALRSVADQIDQLERWLRQPDARPYDRVPLGGLVREFRETYDATFAALQRADDPLTRALADFLATDDGAGPGTGAAARDAADTRPAD